MWNDLILRMRSLFRRDAVERQLDDELRFHLDQLIDAYRQQGFSSEEAARRARLEFGGLEQAREEHRDARGIGALADLARDTRHGLRQFQRSPGFTALAVLCLGLGIGVNTSMFSVLNAVLFVPMPVDAPERLVVVTRGGEAAFSYPVYRDLVGHTRTLSALAVSLPSESDLEIDGDSTFVAQEAVSGGYARVVGARTRLGRWFTSDDESAAVVSYAVWQDRLALDPNVIGRTIRSETQTYTIVGVASREFGGTFSPLRTDIWVPVRTRPGIAALLDDRARRMFTLFGRLADGATAAAVMAELNAIDTQLRAPSPSAVVAPLLVEQVRGFANPANKRRVRVIAAFLMVVVGLVLLIACVNVGNLLLVRGAVRHREFAVRRALGASRARVLRQLLTESLLLAMAGGLCGVILAHWTVALLQRSLPLLQRGSFASQVNLEVDWRVITFATAVSLATTVLCGLLPAVRASRSDGLSAFKGEIVAGTPQRRPLALVAQVAMSFLLLLLAGTFVQALVRMQTADPGFAVANRLYAFTYISTPGVTAAARGQIFQRAIERLSGIPGVRTVSLSFPLPLMPAGSDCISRPNGPRLAVTRGVVDPTYFDTMEIAITAGRGFAPSDAANATPVVVINDRLARALWPNASALGERALIGCNTAEAATIVGVAEDSSIRSLGETPQPHLYLPFAQRYAGGVTAILIETVAPPGNLIEPVRRTLLDVGQGMRVYAVQPLSAHVERSYSAMTWVASVLTSFGLLALALAAVGLYGVVAYRVALRTREIGVRMALGAARTDVFRDVIGQGLSIAAIGVAIGAALMLTMGRALAAIDADIRPPGVGVVVATGAIWLAVSIVATFAPASRASGVDPLVALRYE